jgi:hypothetical protein
VTACYYDDYMWHTLEERLMWHVTYDEAVSFGRFLCIVKARVMPESENKTLMSVKGRMRWGSGARNEGSYPLFKF